MIGDTLFERLTFLFAYDHLPDDLLTSASCSELALAVVNSLGGRVVGYWNRDNPGATAAPDCDGHDFALLEERYIVDIWVRDVAHTAERAVYDLADPADRRRAYELYGEPAVWSVVYAAPDRAQEVLNFEGHDPPGARALDGTPGDSRGADAGLPRAPDLGDYR